MNKIAKIMMSIAAAVVFVMIGKAFILDEAVKGYLVTFFFVGAGLAMLRLFINGMISKMKGKHIGVKIIFFAGLLSVGLPFQNWFRTEVIFAMSKTFIIPSVIVMVASVVLMTVVYGVIYERIRVPYLEEKHA
ncbi:MFS transporter permease [Lysinibacillus endophyticus]|uniref:MFS transporter permease n=1 Tax=Ureibacillus endophyticus TaxID=1978490 RepID=UPI003134B535